MKFKRIILFVRVYIDHYKTMKTITVNMKVVEVQTPLIMCYCAVPSAHGKMQQGLILLLRTQSEYSHPSYDVTIYRR